MNMASPLRVAVSIVAAWSLLFNAIFIDNTIAEEAAALLRLQDIDAIFSASKIRDASVDKFEIPVSLGDIVDRYEGGANDLIIYLQDAHCNYPAQRTIASLLAYLRKVYGTDLVFLEGGKGEYNFSPFTQIPDKISRYNVSNYFMKQGELSAAEYFAINSAEKVNLWGIEDENLYLKNLEAYKNIVTYKKSIQDALDNIGKTLNDFKQKIFSKDLKRSDLIYERYKSGKLEFKLYANYLLAQAIVNNVPHIEKEYPNLSNLYLVLKSEEGIDFKSANSQRDELIGILVNKLPKTRLEDFMRVFVEFKEGRIPEGWMYGYLTNKAAEIGINVRDNFPELSKYLSYCEIYAKIDSMKLMDEISMLQERIFDSLARTGPEKELIALSKHFTYIDGLFNFRLTNTDYASYVKNKGDFGVARYKKYFDTYGQVSKINVELSALAQRLDICEEKAMKFYEYSTKRDEVFIKNIAQKLQLSGPSSPDSKNNGFPRKKISVLITGGFHSANLYRLMRAKNISYVSIVPKFKSDSSPCRYFDILAGKKCDLTCNLEAAVSGLQVASKLNEALGQKVWGERNISLYEASIYVKALAERGNDIEIVDDTTGRVIFKYSDKAVPAKGKPLRLTKNNFFHELHEKFIDSVMGPDEEGYRNLNSHEITAAREAMEEVLNILPQEDPAREKLSKELTGIDNSVFIRVSYNIAKTGRDAHAGGRGIRIREGLSKDEVKKVITHDLLAGILKSHEMVKAVEALMSEKKPLLEIQRLLKDPSNRYKGYKTLWEFKARERKETERDYAQSAVQPEAPEEITDDTIREVLRKESYLTYAEKDAIVKFIILYNADYDQEMRKLRQSADDPARYVVSIREIKRFAADFKNRFLKYSSQQKLNRQQAFEKALQEAYKNIYLDFVGYTPGQSGFRTFDMDESILYGEGIFDISLLRTTYAKLFRGLECDIPTLFIKNKNSIQALDVAIAHYAQANNATVFSMQCTPFSDTSQLIGGYVPRERFDPDAAYSIVKTFVDDDAELRRILSILLNREASKDELGDFRTMCREKSYTGIIIAAAMVKIYPNNWRKKLEYKKGILPRIIEECEKDRERTFILNIENIEALPGRVRAQLNTFLLTEEMWVPGAERESDRYIKKPDNLRIIATMSEESVPEGGTDSAFYDRFIRKSVPACDDTDLEKIISLRHPLLAGEPVRHLIGIKKKFDEEKIKYHTHDFITISDYIAGRFKDIEGKSGKSLLTIMAEEIWAYFQATSLSGDNRIRDAMESYLRNNGLLYSHFPIVGSLFEKNLMSYNKATKEIILNASLPGKEESNYNGIGLKINDAIAQKIDKAIGTFYRGKIEDEDKIIRQVLIDELDFVVTDQERKILCSIARSYKYGNGVICLEGATGAGKTYLAQTLSKLLKFDDAERGHYYAEPIHASTKLSRFVGVFKTDEYGYYSLDNSTKFLDVAEHGGVIALSEINTAVKDDYAKLGWWFTQFARGDNEIFLTEYPGYGPSGAVSPGIKRNKNSLIIIDINPQDYSARGKLPDELEANMPKVYVEKMAKEADIREAAEAFLKHITFGGYRDYYASYLARLHKNIQDKIDELNSAGQKHPPLSFREMRRVCRCLNQYDSQEEGLKKLKKAINRYYISAFKDPAIRQQLRSANNIDAEDIKSIVGSLVLGNAGERSPPTMVFSQAEENPFEELDELIKGRDDVYCEKVTISKFTDEFKLLGDYVPLSAEAKAQAMSALQRGEEWRQKLKYEEGIIPRLIREARKDPAKIFIVAFENFHRIRPGLAVSLNSILQEGHYYDPMSGTMIDVPPNLRFFATAISEVDLPISMAEESRWVRLYREARNRVNELTSDPAEARAYFNDFTSAMTPKLDTDEDELLIDIDELVDVESATFQAFEQGRLVIYEGLPGGGKTDMAIDVAKRMGLDHYVYSCHGRVHASDILGGFIQDHNGNFIFTGAADVNGSYPYNNFLQMLTHGGVFIFDEGAIGKRSEELISLLSSIARCEKIFVMNEVPGRDPEFLKVHEDFHIIITTNPAEDTPGREPLPLEVYNHAKRIWISNELAQDSYRKIIYKFAKDACRKYGVDFKTLFDTDTVPDEFADFIRTLHFAINDLVGVSISLDENTNLHLLTLRDMKKAVYAFIKYAGQGVNKEEALRIAIRVEYLNQFKKGESRNYIVATLSGIFSNPDKNNLKEFFEKYSINLKNIIEKLEEPLKEELLDKSKVTAIAWQRKPPEPVLPKGITKEDLKAPRDFAQDKPILEQEEDLTEEQLNEGYGSIWQEEFTMPEEKNLEKPKTLSEFDAIDSSQLTDDKGYIFTQELTGDLAPITKSITTVNSASDLPSDIDDRIQNGEAFMYTETISEALDKLPLKVNHRKQPPRTLTELYQTLKGDSGGVWSLATIQIDGRDCLVSGNHDGTIKIWDISHNTVQTLRGHGGGICSISTAKIKGRTYLLSGSEDKTIKVWNITGESKTVQTLKGHSENVLSLTTIQIKDKTCIVSVSLDNTIKIWDIDHDTVQTLKGHSGGVLSLTTIQIKGRVCLVSGSHDNTIKIWDITGKSKTVQTLKGNASSASFLTTIQIDGRDCLVSGNHDGTIKIWDISHNTVQTLRGHGGGICSISTAKIKGRTYLLSGSEDKTIKVWNITGESKTVQTLKGHTDGIWSLTTIQIDGRICIVSGSRDNTIKIWDIDYEHEINEAIRIVDKFETTQFEAQRQASIAQLPEPALPKGITKEDLKAPRDFAQDKPILEQEEDLTEEQLNEGYGSIWQEEFTMPEAKVLEKSATFSEFNDIDLDSIIKKKGYIFTQELTGDLAPITKSITTVNLPSELPSDIEDRINNGEAFMYTEAISEALNQLPSIINHRKQIPKTLSELYQALKGHTGSAISLTTIDINGKTYLASGSYDKTIKLWDIENNSVKTLKGHTGLIESLTTIQIDGRTCIVSGSGDNTIKIWDITGESKTVKTLKGHTDSVLSLTTIQIDGRTCIVSGSRDNTIKIWDIEKNTVKTLKGCIDCVCSLTTIDINGKTYLASGSHHEVGYNEIEIWDITGELKTVQILKGHTGLIESLTTIDINGKTYLASGSRDKTIKLWDIENNSVKTLKGHIDWVYSLTTINIKDKTYLASGSRDKTIKLWDIENNSVKTLKGHTRNITSLTTIDINGKTYLASGSFDNTIKLWDLTYESDIDKAIRIVDEFERSQAKIGAGKEFTLPKAEVRKPEITLPEEDSVIEARYALHSSGRILMIMQPGARERVVIDEMARREDVENIYSMEGSPSVTVQDMFGGLMPLLEGEEKKGEQCFIYKPGFFTRHMLTEEEYKDAKSSITPKEPILLVIHNIDAIPEKARAAFNNLLLNDYIEIPGKGRYYLAPHIKIVATINAMSQQDFSSAFPNRFTKINIHEIDARPFGTSDFLKYITEVYKLDRSAAESVESLFCLIRTLEKKGDIWPSGEIYDFTIKDALTHAAFISLGIEERKQLGLSITQKDVEMIVIREALRAYGSRLREHEKDYSNFVEVIMKSVFVEDVDMVDRTGSEFSLLNGKLDSISGIPLSPSQRGEHPYSIDKRYRLTMVGNIVRTLSGIVRGFQANKIVALMGETGVAKTTMGVNLAKLLGIDYYILSMHKGLKTPDITAGIKMTDEGKFKLEIAEFAQKLAKGNVMLIVDEANIKPEILWVLAGIARGEKSFTIEIPGEEAITFALGENVYILLTMNPESYGGGRGALPQPVKEDIFKIWAPSEYPPAQLEAIVNEFFDGYSKIEEMKKGMKAQAIKGVKIDARMLYLSNYIGHEYARLTIEEFAGLIEEKGHHTAIIELLVAPDREEARKKRQELQGLEDEILSRPEVQRRMSNIRTAVGAFCGQKVDIRFTIFNWWSAATDGSIINVPLWEIVEKENMINRSDEAIIGLILHEIRHTNYSPTPEEFETKIISLLNDLKPDEMKLVQSLGTDKTKQNKAFFNLWNAIEDIRIDHMANPRYPGAERFIEAMNREFFAAMLIEEPEQAEKNKQLALTNPAALLKNELLCWGYNGAHSAYFKYLPQPLQQDIITLTEGGNAPFSRATISEAVKVRFDKILTKEDILQEKLRSAAESMRVLLREIEPVCAKWTALSDMTQVGETAGDGEDAYGEGAGGVPQFAEIPLEMLGEPSGTEEKPSGGGIITPGGVVNPGEGDEGEPSPAEGEPTSGGDEAQPGQENGAGAESEAGGQAGSTAQSRSDRFNSAASKISTQRREELKGEPFNARLAEVSGEAKNLARGFVNIFRTTSEMEIEESPFGRIINPIRFLTGSNVPFDEEIDGFGDPDLAFDMTVDTSGSMTRFYPALRRLSAIFLSAFQQIGKKAELGITVDHKNVEPVKLLKERYSQDQLNAAQTKVEGSISLGGDGIHLYDCIIAIIEKYKKCDKRNKLAVIFTDAKDTGGDLKVDGGKLICSERLDAALKEAKNMGIDIIGVGFGSKELDIFESRIQLDPDNADSIINTLLSVCRIKAKTGRIPKGNLNALFDMSNKGMIKRELAGKKTFGERREYTVARYLTTSEETAVNNRITTTTITDSDRTIPGWVREQAAAASQAMPALWRNTTKDIIILPETKKYTTQETGVRNMAARSINKKYEQSTVVLPYTFDPGWEKSLKDAIEEAGTELSTADKKARVLIYVPVSDDGKNKKVVEAILADQKISPYAHRITMIYTNEIEADKPVNITMDTILGKALLNYERYRKGDYAGQMEQDEKDRLLRLMKVMVDNPETVTDISYIERLLDGREFLKARKVDFKTIENWRKIQDYIATSA